MIKWLLSLFKRKETVKELTWIMKRTINEIDIHCSATPPNMDIGVKEIRQWHVAKNWSDIGYHDVIRRDGTLEEGRPLERAGAHIRGRNANSIAVCMIGGVKADMEAANNFTKEQFDTLRRVHHLTCKSG